MQLTSNIQSGQFLGQVNHEISPMPFVLNLGVPSAGNPFRAVKAAKLCSNHCPDCIRITAKIHGTNQTLLWPVAIAKECPEGGCDCFGGANAIANGVDHLVILARLLPFLRGVYDRF